MSLIDRMFEKTLYYCCECKKLIKQDDAVRKDILRYHIIRLNEEIDGYLVEEAGYFCSDDCVKTFVEKQTLFYDGVRVSRSNLTSMQFAHLTFDELRAMNRHFDLKKLKGVEED